MSDRTSGVFLLHEKRAEHLIGSAISGVGEDGNAFVRLKLYPKLGVFSIPSVGALELRADVAFDLVGLIHVLLATVVWLGGAEIAISSQQATSPVVRAIGPPRHRIFECRFDEGESFEMGEEPDGLCTLQLSARVAHQLALALASELGRIAAWVPDGGREGPAK